MKTHFISKAISTFVALALTGAAAHAQAIKKSQEPFVEVQTLPFAPAAALKPLLNATLAVENVVAIPAPIVVAPVAPPPPPPLETWTATSGSLLSDTLSAWSKQAGWAFVWGMSEKEDFRMDAGNTYAGDFKTVVTSLINSIPPHIRIRAELVTDNIPPLLYINKEEGAK